MIISRDEQIRSYILLNGRHSYFYHLLKEILQIEKMFPNAQPSERWLSEYPHDIVEGIPGSKSEDEIIHDMSFGIGLTKNFPYNLGWKSKKNRLIVMRIEKDFVMPAVKKHRQMMHHQIWEYIRNFDNKNFLNNKNIETRMEMLRYSLNKHLDDNMSIDTLKRYVTECAADAVGSNLEDREYQDGIHPLSEIIGWIIPEKNFGIHKEYMRIVVRKLEGQKIEDRVKELNETMTIDNILSGIVPNLGINQEEHQKITEIIRRTLLRWQGYRPNLLIV